jgi:glycosyltransferase involved in cell wall biosynthesis
VTTKGSRPLASPFRVIILMPVYRDWECASSVCRRLDEELSRLLQAEAHVLLVDDGSPDGTEGWTPFEVHAIARIDALRLRRNVGHQRAICVGICYIYEHMPCDAVLVMDADGEDRPDDAVRLVEMAMSNPGEVFFAERRKRFEGAVFQAGYTSFRILHRILTGVAVRVGNFSIVPSGALGRLTCMTELWSHYAGAVFKSRIRFECIPMDRGRRVQGRSQMDLVSLVIHGITGISTAHETVATRILVSNVIGVALLFVILVVVFGVRLLTDRAIPGWATYVVGLVLILLTQLLAVSFSLVFSLISNRINMTFVPVRDYPPFVDKLDNLARLE